MNTNIIELLLQLKKEFNSIDNIEEKVQMLNLIKNNLKEISPFMDPVDNVKWIPMNKIKANSYNPNRVAGPEMKLLYDSIKCDGYNYKNFYGTYTIGPLLVRNPKLLTYLLNKLIKEKYKDKKIKKVDLKLDELAYKEFINNYYK